MEEEDGGGWTEGAFLKGLKKERRGEDYKHGGREEKGQKTGRANTCLGVAATFHHSSI